MCVWAARMKRKWVATLWVFWGLVIYLPWLARSQSFQNLDFEQAVITNSMEGQPLSTALPGWSAFAGGAPVTNVVYEVNILDGAYVGLYHQGALFGQYSAYLQDDNGVDAQLVQRGTIPSDAKSIQFYTSLSPFSGLWFNRSLQPHDFEFSLSINGQAVPFSPIQVETNILLWAADVSGFAGQQAELRFALSPAPPSAPYHDVGAIIVLDNISFSNEPIHPLIARPLMDQSTFIGASVQFSVETNGSGPFKFQWLYKGQPMAGQTNSTLELDQVRSDQAGLYAVTVSDPSGSLTSPAAKLEVSMIAEWGSVPAPPPSSLSNVVSISAGSFHIAALKEDGTVVAWGANSYGESQVPTGLSNVVAIAAGFAHTVALRADGTVALWGFPNAVLPGLTGVVSVAASYPVTLALRSDGAVAGWGQTLSGGGGAPLPPMISGAVSIAMGELFGMALLNDSTVTTWGSTTLPFGLSNIVAIACGSSHALALKNNGTVIAWGDNIAGQTDVPPGLSNVVAIAAGSLHSLALTSDGMITSWGSITNVPYGLTNVTAIAAGPFSRYSLALVGTGTSQRPLAIEKPQLSTTGFNVAIHSARSRVYQLQSKSSLSDPRWKPMLLVAGNGDTLVLTDSSGGTGPRFYRVVQW